MGLCNIKGKRIDDWKMFETEKMLISLIPIVDAPGMENSLYDI